MNHHWVNQQLENNSDGDCVDQSSSPPCTVIRTLHALSISIIKYIGSYNLPVQIQKARIENIGIKKGDFDQGTFCPIFF